MIDCCIDSFENCFSLRLGNGFVYCYGTIIRVCIFSEGQKFGQEKKRRYIIHKCKVSSSSLIHRFRLGSIYFSKLDFGIIFFYGKKQVLHVPRLKADYGFCASVDVPDQSTTMYWQYNTYRQYVLENVRSLFLLKLTQYTSYIIYQQASEYIFFFFNNFR